MGESANGIATLESGDLEQAARASANAKSATPDVLMVMFNRWLQAAFHIMRPARGLFPARGSVGKNFILTFAPQVTSNFYHGSER
jgi:hypothetical protein